MSNDSKLDTCGACEGVTALTPASVENSPGLPALSWRVGTQARFKQSLLAALSDDPALRTLTARGGDDPSIALLDAWAAALDVLAFYQERVANENYLRTATELRSILELARAIGYELRPGVSASALLAFTLENKTIPGAIPAATISAGAKIQSIPGQNEQPQVFETSAGLDARAAWNSLAGRTRGSAIPQFSQQILYLQGVSTGLQPGDALLVIGDERVGWAGSERWDFRRVQSMALNVPADPSQSYTAITIDRPLGKDSPHVEPAKKNPRVFAMRRRATLFGANAPDPRMLSSDTLANFSGSTTSGWANFNTSYSSTISDTVIYLDGAQPVAVQGSW
ncbi:MAG: putative baseplate assembly protein, partial [Verrucomicrobiota bacterium]|nr:putative baseplate assembly protein [Verrucomicrobiota bacterium]